MMLPDSLIQSLINREPKFDDILSSLQSTAMLPRGIVKETKKVMALARKFTDEIVRPNAIELDRRMHTQPDYLPYDFIKKANEWDLYSMWLPKMVGGKGFNTPSLTLFLEEVASACLSMANLIGVHYLGVVTLSASFNLRLFKRVCQETLEGQRTGKPCLISLAVTEPGAGTDVEETELIDRGNIAGHAEKVKGGYVLNGTKIFISNGHLSTWHMVIAYADLKKPSESMVMLAVKTGTEGFSFGRQERKMGQKACPASELIFKDCFIPDENVCIDSDQMKYLSIPARETAQRILDYILATSRAGVGAFGTGVARGAYETALQFASQTKVAGKLLINHEWAQCMLTEMYKNVMLARLSYLETNYANALYGSLRPLLSKPVFFFNQHMPVIFFEKILSRWLNLSSSTRQLRKQNLARQKISHQQCTSGWASLSKFSTSDLGVKNCQMALEMMGQAGLRHDRRAEKHFRDAKLLQIYEGTNQLNRLNVFKCLIGRSFPQAVVFDE
jgi:alkylation response protein AidB-like acyl-CoA dehydrogenase